MTYIVSDVAELILTNWHQIPERSQKLILKELKEAISEDDLQREEGNQYRRLGMDMDYQVWSNLYEKLLEHEVS